MADELGSHQARRGERVRVARALRQLPLVSAAFGRGRISYSKVRATTRVAGEQTEETLVTYARQFDGGAARDTPAEGVPAAEKELQSAGATPSDPRAACDAHVPGKRG